MHGTAARLKLIGTILGVVLAGYVFGAALDWLRLPGVVLDRTLSLDELSRDRTAPSVGPARPALTVIVFTDYQCGVCRIDHSGIARVVATAPNARFVFKEWAILGPASREAARIALAAGYQDRYLEMRDALMMGRGGLDAQRIRAAAVTAGADWSRLQRDLATHGRAIEDEIARTSRQAFGLGLAGTPAYLIADRLVIGRLTESKLRRLIARAAGASNLSAP